MVSKWFEAEKESASARYSSLKTSLSNETVRDEKKAVIILLQTKSKMLRITHRLTSCTSLKFHHPGMLPAGVQEP